MMLLAEDKTPSSSKPGNAYLEQAIRRWAPTDEADRRRNKRISIPVLMRLEPLGSSNKAPAATASTVVGKDLSPRGIGFYHQERLPHKQVELTIDDPNLGQLVLEVELTWCRFTKLGWYESGGRVLRCVQSAANAA